eukprot:scaffold111403_cov32-Prasinocladus_malaysianus.AAC.1
MAGDQGPFCLAVIGVLYDLITDDMAPENGFSEMMEKLGELPDNGEQDTGPVNEIDFNAFLP